MHAASRDVKLILTGIVLAWVVHDLMTHSWREAIVGTFVLVSCIGMSWPIEIFDYARRGEGK